MKEGRMKKRKKKVRITKTEIEKRAMRKEINGAEEGKMTDVSTVLTSVSYLRMG